MIKKLVLVSAGSLILFFGQAKADECSWPRYLISQDLQTCNNYQSYYPHMSFTVGYRYFTGYYQLKCIGTYAGHDFINFYGGLISQNGCVPQPPKKKSNENPDSCKMTGSTIEVSNRTVGERIPLTGTSFDLVYFSNRVIGRKADYKTTIDVTGANSSLNTTELTLSLKDENDSLIQKYDYRGIQIVPNISIDHEWNGLDSNSVETWGSVKRSVDIGEVATDGTFPPRLAEVFLGNLKAKKLGTGAWLPSIWHFYDHVAKRLYKGDGSFRNASAVVDGVYFRVPDESGKEIYYFDSVGKIVFTKTALTGSTKFSFAYDSAGRLSTITEPFNRVTTFSRYLTGVLKAIVAPNGSKASTFMDSNGYLTKLINPNNETYLMSYSGAGGLLTSFEVPSGDVTTLTYDGDGNLQSDSHSNGYSLNLNKTLNGITATTSMGLVNEIKYDYLDEKESRTNPMGYQTSETNTANSKQLYSPLGNRIINYQVDPRLGAQVKLVSGLSTNDFGARSSTYTTAATLLDPANIFSINKITRIETVGNSVNTSEFDGATKTFTNTSKLGRVTRTKIDDYERTIFEQRGSLVARDYIYTDNLLTKITEGTRKIVMSYYSNDLIKSIRNSLDQVTSFTYDSALRLKTKTLPDSRVITYNYDYNGNVTSITPPGKGEHLLNFGINDQLVSYNPPLLASIGNTVTNYTYDNDKRVTSIERPDGEELNFNYYPNTGLLSTITGNFGSIGHTYSLGLLTNITGQYGNSIQMSYTGETVSNATLAISGSNVYSYSKSPNTNAGGKKASETITGFGAASVSRTINYSYDDDEYLIKAGDLDLVYDVPNGQLKGTTLAYLTDTYYYDAFGDVRKYIAKHGSNIIYQYELTRDSLGRIIKKSETVNGVLAVYDYSFDSSGRLVQVNKNGILESSYTYDSNSNRIGGVVRGENISATYDEQDRLVSYNGHNFSYNQNGELLTKDSANFVYDVFGNLKEYSSGTLNVAYETDPMQRRLGRVVNGDLTSRYAYNPEGQVVGQLDDHNKLVKTFVYATKGHVPDYYIDQYNNKFRIITDHLGSVRLVVSRTGRILQEMNHDEFGNVLSDSRPGFLPFGFAGGLYEYRTGLVRFGARDYDPEIGRWLSKDPISFKGGDTNLYGYVLQDPLNAIDPKGTLSPISVAACLAGFAAGGAYDVYSSLKDQQDLQDSLDQQLQALDKKKTACSNDSDKLKIEQQKHKLLGEFQKQTLANAAGVFTPGYGSQAAAVACIMAISTF